MPESLRLKRGADAPVEEESEEWENEIERDPVDEEEEEVEVAVQGVLKRWSELTEQDLHLMSDDEYATYVKICDEDEWE